MDDIKQNIRELLDEWQHTQLNISSESARDLLTMAIMEKIEPTINQLLEDIICPANEHRG